MSNLDEFFQVRVAGLMGQEESGLLVRSPDGRTPQQTLAAVREKTLELTADQAKLWKRDLRPALADGGVVVGDVDDANKKELEELERRFERDVFPILTPLAVGPGQPFPYISPLSLSLGIFVRDPETGEERFARVKVPELLPRFLAIGDRGLFLPLERVIRHFLPRLFPGMEIVECCTFRVTRDADFEVSDEADDLLEAVQDELRRRRFGDVVRVEVSGSVSTRMLDRLKRGLRATDDQIYLIQGLLDLAELQELVQLDRPDLKDEPWYPVVHPRFATAADAQDLFAEVQRGDILVHHPFDSFVSSFEGFLKAASEDPVGRRAQDRALPHERRLTGRSCADRGSRAGQAKRVADRAQGAVRRIAQHRVVALARAGRRARRLRVPELEDPREDDARGAQGG
jgi:polyphosphate kinase